MEQVAGVSRLVVMLHRVHDLGGDGKVEPPDDAPFHLGLSVIVAALTSVDRAVDVSVDVEGAEEGIEDML